MAWRTTLFSPNQISLHTQNHTQNLSVETEEEEVILVVACTRNTSMPFANGKNRHAKRKKHWSSSLMIYRTSFVCAFKCIIWTVSTQPFSFRFPHTEMMTFNGIEMGFNPKQLVLCFAQIKWSQSVWVRLVEECWKNDWMTIHHGVMWSILYENWKFKWIQPGRFKFQPEWWRNQNWVYFTNSFLSPPFLLSFGYGKYALNDDNVCHIEWGFSCMAYLTHFHGKYAATYRENRV